MDRLVYTALSGMNAAMTRQRITASNMANTQTIGFRAETLQQTPVTIDGQQMQVRSMNQAQVRGAEMRQGAFTETGRPLDIAMQGDAMLAVQASDGSEAYTRRGDLSISATGVLQNGEGLPVIGEGGPITVPLGSRIAITQDGAVTAANPEAPDQPPIEVARLKLVNWRGTNVAKGLDGLFRAPQNGVLPTDDTARVATATLEQSNVRPTEVLVEMVEAQRMFDIRTKMISTARELDEGSASLMRISPA